MIFGADREFWPRFYRLDGSPYTGTAEEILEEWGRDMEDSRGRIVRQELLWNGLWVSTVWLGTDHNWSRHGPPIIFESMVFDHLTHAEPEIQERYATLAQAEAGHRAIVAEVRRLGWTLRHWWRL